MADHNPKTDSRMERTAGTIRSAGAAVPEIKSIMSVPKRSGWNAAIGSAIPRREIRATIPPVKRILVNACRNRTHPNIRMLKYKKPVIQREAAAKAV